MADAIAVKASAEGLESSTVSIPDLELNSHAVYMCHHVCLI